MSTIVAALIASAVCVPASVAQAPANAVQIPTVTISYADLNLSTEAGSRALYYRLVEAAYKVCPERDDSLLALRLNREADRCVTAAVERAVKGIKNPKFAQVAASYMR
ncbi:MAG: UrcA family protein [Gammaproteobacteria bacterium]